MSHPPAAAIEVRIRRPWNPRKEPAKRAQGRKKRCPKKKKRKRETDAPWRIPLRFA